MQDQDDRARLAILDDPGTPAHEFKVGDVFRWSGVRFRVVGHEGADLRVAYMDDTTHGDMSPPTPAGTLGRFTPDMFRGSPAETVEPDPATDLRAAKERLGAWLAAEERRTWELALIQPFGAREQYWYAALFAGTSTSGEQAARCVAEERGPTEAAAIFAALEKANGGA